MHEELISISILIRQEKYNYYYKVILYVWWLNLFSPQSFQWKRSLKAVPVG
jgi:hypothetical protein